MPTPCPHYGGVRAALAVVFVDDAADTTRIGRMVSAAARDFSTAIR